MKTSFPLLAAVMLLAPVGAGLAQCIVITTQPGDRFLTGQTATSFAVTASGTNLTYQWLFNGAQMADATNRTLTLASSPPATWGYYSVIVSNPCGSVTSQVAELKVFTAARHSLSGIQAQPDGSMNLSFAGETTMAFGRYYDQYPLECSSNLTTWAPLATVQRSNRALDSLQFLDTNAVGFTQRFYRTPTNVLATPDPAPTGPYAVGTFSMVMTDPSRTNTAGRGTNYQFMTTFWYPTVPQAGVLPAIYVEPQIALSGYYDFTYYGGANFGSQVAAFYSHSLSNAPLATNLTKYPVVIYSPGAGNIRNECIDRVEDLASWGYLVVGLDTSDTYMSVFPGGRVVYAETSFGTNYGQWVAEIERRVRDLQFVLDQLAVLNASDPRLVGRLDLDKIGAFGHSLGGFSSVQLCIRDSRCKACASSDGVFLESNQMTRPLGFPWLYFRSGAVPDPVRDRVGVWQDPGLQLYSQQQTNAYWVRLASTVHGSFMDFGLICDSASLASTYGTPMSGQFLIGGRLSQILRAYLLSFFNKFLLGIDDHLLDGAPPAYPEVMEFLSAGHMSGPPRYPVAPLVQGSDGSFYGTTAYGGAYGLGTAFQLTTNGVSTTLLSFNGTNGNRPSTALIQATDGNFYGTTPFGGTNGNHGTVFRMTPAGVLTTLVSFDGTNGAEPFAPLMQASDGNFYGTAVMGGANNLGTVFQMTPAGALITLVSFDGTNNAAFPFAGLALGTNGNFYGTTSAYGTADGGSTSHVAVAFQMTPAGVLTPLASFTGANGLYSVAGLVLGTNGLFYGTTEYGGNVNLNGAYAERGFGTVFRMTSAGALTRLVIFNGANGSHCVSGLAQGSDGNFYGTTAGGGGGGSPTGGGGTVFQMGPNGGLTTLVSFNGANGSNPEASLIQGSDGNFYGTTTYGGPNGGGTVFQVTTNGVLTTLVSFGSATNSP